MRAAWLQFVLVGSAVGFIAGCGGQSASGDIGAGGPAPGLPSGSAPGPGGGNSPIQPSPGATGSGGSSGAGGAAGASAVAPGSPPAGSGSFGSVGIGGGQDFGAFRRALNGGLIPATSTLDAAGFFAEHFTSLPPPTCGKTFCLHGMLSVSPDMVRGGRWTLLQMGMNSPIDPATVTKPPLALAVVVDRSGSMAAAGKMDYAKQGLKLLVNALSEGDTFTLIAFDDQIQTLFGPAHVSNKASLIAIVDALQPRGSTNIYGGLEAGYKAAISTGDETQQRRVIFLTDGLPTVGITDPTQIKAMSAGYNERYIGLTTIGLGTDVDAGLLRNLSEQGGGNFYFAEKPEAVQEVFTEELAFFVAPIAYDLELRINELPAYTLKQVLGTNLWRAENGGGRVRIPSVFLVSRTSTKPGANGGRRGGGSAIMAELAPTPTLPAAGLCNVAALQLSYRLPGSSTIETQTADIGYDVGTVAGGDTAAYYSSRDIEKNTIILALFTALRDATARAQNDPRGARDLLVTFQPKFKARIAGWADDDLIDDIVILQQYIDVLGNIRGVGPVGP
ncbi:MAG TPA: VWA domain-containing protein [Polyangia bacterium]|nr:VWA domain-containing protein [Polyangia bacterium]